MNDHYDNDPARGCGLLIVGGLAIAAFLAVAVIVYLGSGMVR